MAGLTCAGCGRVYGVRATDVPTAALRDTDGAGAQLAALLTGWQQDGTGAWFCGLPGCRPGTPPADDTPAGPWWQGWASKHV